MSLRHYAAIARPDHWMKNVFVLPGAFVAAVLLKVEIDPALALRLGAALASTCFLASSNYVINEWLDAESDRHHPTKRNRPFAAGALEGRWVYAEYALLAAAGLAVAAFISPAFLVTGGIFLFMGVLYNVKPMRAKDRPFLDVLVESLNNPLRLTLGWFVVTTLPLPPSSLVVSYWMGGAFLMAVKRFGEYRFISNPGEASAYRRSFAFYTEESLLISSFFYAMLCTLLLGVFLVKYRIELLLSLPFIAVLFAWYLRLAFKPDSPVQHPERLHTERGFTAYCVLLVIILLVLFWIDIEPLRWFLDKAFITEG
jgi:4-hydroxybenzoate polyprenyltransferase